MIPLILPWPDRILHPNSRPHWAQLAKAKKAARESAAWSTKATWPGFVLPDGRLHLWIDFYAPDKRRHVDFPVCVSPAQRGRGG